jgi:hypothetical protein
MGNILENGRGITLRLIGCEDGGKVEVSEDSVQYHILVLGEGEDLPDNELMG